MSRAEATLTGGYLLYRMWLIVFVLSLALAGPLPDGSRVNFIAVGSRSSERTALVMARSFDGKKWFHSRVLREFPPRRNNRNDPGPTVVAFGK